MMGGAMRIRDVRKELHINTLYLLPPLCTTLYPVQYLLSTGVVSSMCNVAVADSLVAVQWKRIRSSPP